MLRSIPAPAAFVCALAFSCPAHAGSISPDLYFDGDRYRAAAIEAQARKARPTSVRKARVVHRRKPAARRVVVANRQKAALKPDNYRVIIAPLDAPPRPHPLYELSSVARKAFGSIDSYDPRIVVPRPQPARADLFDAPPPRNLFHAVGKAIDRAFHSLFGLTVLDVAGHRAVVAARHAGKFEGFFRDLLATGYRIDFVGCYNKRRIFGTNLWSNHSDGSACDVNQTARNIVTRAFPSNINAIAARHGLKHGAVWRNPDGGHFEVAGRSYYRVARKPAKSRTRVATR